MWRLPKPFLLAMAGCVGVWLGGLAGHFFLHLTWREPPKLPDRHALCLVLDVSGSMEGPPLEAVQRATIVLGDELDYSKYRLALAVFNHESRLIMPLMSSQLPKFATEVGALKADGGTNMHAGLQNAVQALKQVNVGERKGILLFTDGEANHEAKEAIVLAQKLRDEGYAIVCVAAGDADTKYLARLAGSFRQVIRVTDGDFMAAFRQATGLLTGKQLVAGGHVGGTYTFQEGVLRIGVWTALLGCGIGAALAMMQGRLLYRRWWMPKHLLKAGSGALLLGLLAGAVGQGAYDGASTFLEKHVWAMHDVFGYLGLAALLATALVKKYRLWCAGALIVFAGLWFWSARVDAFVEFFQDASRMVGWIVLALALAVGMGLFIPNYRYSWAWIGGLAAGTVMGVLFYVLNLQLSDTAATWAGITVLGIVIGLLVGLIENFGAEMVAEIEYENGEKVRVNLGDKTVTLPDTTDESKTIVLSRDNITGPGTVAEGVAISEGKATHIGGMKITMIKRKKEGES